VSFTVPGRPVGKGRPRFNRRTGAAYTPAATASYENWVKVRAVEAMHGHAPFAGAVALEIVATFVPPASWSRKKTAAALAGEVMPTSRPDLDNIEKVIMDAGNGVLWRDD